MAATPERRTEVAFAQVWAQEAAAGDEVLSEAHARAVDLGVGATDDATGALLAVLAAATSARAVVEVGTGAGVSGLWLLRGMAADGVLTTIDVEAEYHRAARQTFSAAGFAGPRFRLINGSAGEVLPRLTDAAYDLVAVDADPAGYPASLDQAARLLRPGGVAVFAGVLAGNRVADAAARDHDTVALRELVRAAAADERFTAALPVVGDGALVVARTRNG